MLATVLMCLSLSGEDVILNVKKGSYIPRTSITAVGFQSPHILEIHTVAGSVKISGQYTVGESVKNLFEGKTTIGVMDQCWKNKIPADQYIDAQTQN